DLRPLQGGGRRPADLRPLRARPDAGRPLRRLRAARDRAGRGRPRARRALGTLTAEDHERTHEGDTMTTTTFDQVFVGGQWRPSATGETYATITPATEEESARVAKGDERDIDAAVQAARRAFSQGPWPKMSAAERGRILWKLGDLITANLDEMARLE